ncbi:hypothetical protein IMZ48_09015 [Candidatus Bathyarchaeota archaeon]|nr:hypothetical protein [Candidatus Bathyarchaeota archaeon]
MNRSDNHHCINPQAIWESLILILRICQLISTSGRGGDAHCLHRPRIPERSSHLSNACCKGEGGDGPRM